MIELKKVHCFFEQSGTFKNEFKKLGYEAEDYDIQNNFGETDNVIDLFGEIEKEYDNLTRQDKTRQDKTSVFANIDPCQDLIMAFFPCIYFCQMSQYMQSLNSVNYRHLTTDKALIKIMERQENRQRFLNLLTKFVYICIKLNIKMIFENPITDSFLNHYFLKSPDVKDMNRMKRGDYFNKPTGYWFWNFEPSYGESFQNDKIHKTINKAKSSSQAGLCSEERSMISPDYARNFICDFILGEVQEGGQQSLFE